MKSRLQPVHLIIIFLLGALPLAATFIWQYPDERHYTDGALTMLRDHDWLVPKTAADNAPDWVPRFQKPPLAYWLTAASFSVLGVNPFAARLPFLLACAGTLALTWRLARRLTGSAATAQLAMVILLAHVQFGFCAARAIPDALLIFAVTLSAFGFLRLLALGEFTLGAYAMAYGGAALAAMSKGFLGLGIVLFAWAFAWARERKFSAVKKLWHWPSLAVATLLATMWFVAVIWRYGAAAWLGFFDDQVTGNLEGSVFGPLWRVPEFGLVLAVNFLPWSLPALEHWWRSGRTWPTGALPAPARQFILAWAAGLVVAFAVGSNVSLRYLLPAAPLLAVWLADGLAQVPAAGRIFTMRRVLKFLLGLLLGLNLVALLVQLQWPVPILPVMAVGIFAAVIVVLGFGALRWGWLTLAEAAGLAMLLIFPLGFFAAAPVALPDPCEQMAVCLQRAGVRPGEAVLFVGRPAMASGLRLMLREKCRVVRTGELTPDALGQYALVLAPQSQVDRLRSRGYGVQPAATVVRWPGGAKLWAGFRARNLPEVLEASGEKYLLLSR
ncbi:MAG: hypothetical protein RL380_410 [Verrucomicrobiota bacterium]|jgi:4-amino-4-deoxy-L-arabinose transferase-like glycosyltransferase